MRVSSTKDTYCHTCEKSFHYLGIARHRASHRAKKEDCVITFTNGKTYKYLYSNWRLKMANPFNIPWYFKKMLANGINSIWYEIYDSEGNYLFCVKDGEVVEFILKKVNEAENG